MGIWFEILVLIGLVIIIAILAMIFDAIEKFILKEKMKD